VGGWGRLILDSNEGEDAKEVGQVGHDAAARTLVWRAAGTGVSPGPETSIESAPAWAEAVDWGDLLSRRCEEIVGLRLLAPSTGGSGGGETSGGVRVRVREGSMSRASEELCRAHPGLDPERAGPLDSESSGRSMSLSASKAGSGRGEQSPPSDGMWREIIEPMSYDPAASLPGALPPIGVTSAVRSRCQDAAWRYDITLDVMLPSRPPGAPPAASIGGSSKGRPGVAVGPAMADEQKLRRQELGIKTAGPPDTDEPTGNRKQRRGGAGSAAAKARARKQRLELALTVGMSMADFESQESIRERKEQEKKGVLTESNEGDVAGGDDEGEGEGRGGTLGASARADEDTLAGGTKSKERLTGAALPEVAMAHDGATPLWRHRITLSAVVPPRLPYPAPRGPPPCVTVTCDSLRSHEAKAVTETVLAATPRLHGSSGGLGGSLHRFLQWVRGAADGGGDGGGREGSHSVHTGKVPVKGSDVDGKTTTE